MRLFVALPLSEDAREHVRRAVEPLWGDDRLAWTRPDGWHVTLAFLGEVDGEVDGVVEVVGPVALRHPPVTLTSGEVSVLGRRVVALAVDDDPGGAVAMLGTDTQQALMDADLPVHVRPVRPHLTLARARRGKPVPSDVREWAGPEPVSWTADRVEIVQSVLGRGPARYVPYASIGLEPGTDVADQPPTFGTGGSEHLAPEHPVGYTLTYDSQGWPQRAGRHPQGPA